VNNILESNIRDYGVPRSMIHLASTKSYDPLPDFNGPMAVPGIQPPIPPTWQSPFLGNSLSEIAEWVRGIPKPPKAVCKAFFAVLRKEVFEERGMVVICKVGNGNGDSDGGGDGDGDGDGDGGGKGGEVQTLPWTASRITGWLVAYNRDNWHDDWEDQVWG
jgi:hypothetical protein